MLVWQLVVVVVSQSEEGCEGWQPTVGWEGDHVVGGADR